jgi:hypothetical protein
MGKWRKAILKERKGKLSQSLFVEVRPYASKQIRGLNRRLVLGRVGVDQGISARCGRFNGGRAQRDGLPERGRS